MDRDMELDMNIKVAEDGDYDWREGVLMLGSTKHGTFEVVYLLGSDC
jgi:hypothetical protein